MRSLSFVCVLVFIVKMQHYLDFILVHYKSLVWFQVVPFESQSLNEQIQTIIITAAAK